MRIAPTAHPSAQPDDTTWQGMQHSQDGAGLPGSGYVAQPGRPCLALHASIFPKRAALTGSAYIGPGGVILCLARLTLAQVGSPGWGSLACLALYTLAQAGAALNGSARVCRTGLPCLARNALAH